MLRYHTTTNGVIMTSLGADEVFRFFFIEGVVKHSKTIVGGFQLLILHVKIGLFLANKKRNSAFERLEMN